MSRRMSGVWRTFRVFSLALLMSLLVTMVLALPANMHIPKPMLGSPPPPVENRHEAFLQAMLQQRVGERLFSENALLLRLSDHEALLDINSESIIYPASLSKIMTAVVAIEKLPDLNVRIRMPEWIYPVLEAADASIAGFSPGEMVPARDLLYGVLLPSGADATLALAIHISGSEENFVALLNQKAKALGMEKSHFINVSGLHNMNHYSTARDLAVLLEYALSIDQFRRAFTAADYTTVSTELHPEGILLRSTMFRRLGSPQCGEAVVLGGKTGYTRRAGLCLASLALADGEEYILVTTGAYNEEEEPEPLPLHLMDARMIYESFFQP